MPIFWVVIPGNNWHCALRLKHVSGRRIVENDGVLHVSSDFGHVLREYSVDVGAVLSEQSHGTIPIWIHQVHQRVCVLTQTCRENDQFKILRHGFQKVVHTWPFGDKNVADVPLDIYRDGVVRVFDLVEL